MGKILVIAVSAAVLLAGPAAISVANDIGYQEEELAVIAKPIVVNFEDYIIEDRTAGRLSSLGQDEIPRTSEDVVVFVELQ